jgi:hypothetical protein
MYATPSSIQFLIELLLFVPTCNEMETKGKVFLINQNKTTHSAGGHGQQERP